MHCISHTQRYTLRCAQKLPRSKLFPPSHLVHLSYGSASAPSHDVAMSNGAEDRKLPHTPYSNSQRPPISLKTLGMLLNGPSGPELKPSKNHGRWSLRLCVRRIRGLVSGLTPENAIAAAEWVVTSESLPESLRPRVLVKASYAFLRAGNFPGALRMYRRMLSSGYSPPPLLVAALYRASKKDVARKAKDVPTKFTSVDTAPESFTLLDDQSLGLLLSTMELSRRPEAMEEIIREHIAQVSDSCFEDPSVVGSMIRVYHGARQLDGCYSWFQRFRERRKATNKPIPAAPYARLMTASRKLMPENIAALYRILRTMREDGVEVTTPIYNEILSAEVENRHFKRAFSILVALQRGPPSLQPDAYTLSVIFDALWKNAIGPRHNPTINPHSILHQMLHASHPSTLTVHSSNAALRYFVHSGDFSSALEIVKTMMTRAISPNTLTIRWTLEEIIKRCRAAFHPTASAQLEEWARLLLGGLTRDHFAHTSHLLDIVWSTRDDTRYRLSTQATKDALVLVHKTLASWRSVPQFPTKEQRELLPVLSMIYDLLQVCDNPACDIRS